MVEPTIETRIALRNYPKDAIPLMEQNWRDILFLHWEYDPAEIQKTLPKGLHVDLFDKKAYISLSPYLIKDVRVKMMPAIPGLSDLLGMNLRTYVYNEAGIPGVWFYSLDANSFLAVQMANSFYYLPYYYAEMESHVTANNEIAFRSQRQGTGYSVEFLYKSAGQKHFAEPNTLDFFLLERYALYSKREDGQLNTARVYHTPYPFTKVEVLKWDDTVFEWDRLKRPGRAPDYCHYSPGVDIDVFSLTSL